MKPEDKPPHLKLLAYAVLATLVTLAVLAGVYELAARWFGGLTPEMQQNLRYAAPILPLALVVLLLWLRRKPPPGRKPDEK